MLDLNGYADLSQEPMVDISDDIMPTPINNSMNTMTTVTRPPLSTFTRPEGRINSMNSGMSISGYHPEMNEQRPDVDAQFSSNVQTLMRLVNDLPEGVTKQTGAQIIRITMEAMGISMEEVLTEAQAAQSEMLDAVRANIKKIEEFKTVIRKLETDIKYYQGKANDLSEIIDLFILSNTSSPNHIES